MKLKQASKHIFLLWVYEAAGLSIYWQYCAENGEMTHDLLMSGWIRGSEGSSVEQWKAKSSVSNQRSWTYRMLSCFVFEIRA